MSGYQRMISYLYRYEQGIKTANTGYARIEQQNGRCRVTVRLQDVLTILPEMSFFIQKNDHILIIPSEKLKRMGNSFGTRIETQSERIMDTAYSFSDIDGIYLPVSDSVFYATTWKELQIHADKVIPAGEGTAAAIEGAGTAGTGDAAAAPETDVPDTGRSDAAAERAGTAAKGTIAANEYRADVPDGSRNGAATEGTDVPAAQKNPDQHTLEKQELKGQSRRAENSENSSAAQESGKNQDFAGKIIAMFPKMYPFEIETMGECVRLDLKDIGYLPVQHWSLAGNPFLLHGYYCYRHLIFTQMPEEGSHHGEYVIGVPGIYSRNNQLNSEECGFSGFQPLTEVPDLQGAFGYWLYEIA